MIVLQAIGDSFKSKKDAMRHITIKMMMCVDAWIHVFILSACTRRCFVMIIEPLKFQYSRSRKLKVYYRNYFLTRTLFDFNFVEFDRKTIIGTS